jgi:cytochrome c peroxidase
MTCSESSEKSWWSLLAWAGAALLAACGPAAAPDVMAEEPEPATPALDAEEVRRLLALPDRLELPAIPGYNPISAAKIELGRHLFYDQRLSGNQTQSCESCHLQRLAFADGERTPTGSTGERLFRNSPGLANAFYHSTLTWANSGLLDLERQLEVPIRGDNPVELGVSDGLVEEVLARFDTDELYAELFSSAFPLSKTGATVEKITFALASFCRTLVSASSAYDRYVEGDKSALSESQRRGLALFSGERLECFHCHAGANLTVSYRDQNTTADTARYPFFNNGLYDTDGEGSYPAIDQGLYELTLRSRDRGLFRPPSLRNVALTAPYMHDGSIADLRGVIEHYAAGGTLTESGPNAGDGRKSPLKSGLVRGFRISEEEMSDVLAFLDALTDPDFVENPAFANPWLEATP